MRILWAAGAALLLLQGCTTGAKDRWEKPHVLVVTIDTARADRFFAPVGEASSTPRLDAFASRGTVFTQAVTSVPLTLPSHTSLFTGNDPPTHGVRNNGVYRLKDEAATLAEVLSGQGYRTGAFVGAAVLDSKLGLDQGFDHYDDDVYGDRFRLERRAEKVLAAAGSWLAAAPERPTFAWVHLFDPHAPYDPPEPERSRFRDSAYDGEIAYVDRLLGGFLERLPELLGPRPTFIVVTSDHGESLGEHGEETHGVFLYDATVRVPLLVVMGEQEAGRRVDSQVRLIDVFPTLLEALGLPTPEAVDGRSLLPLLRGVGTGVEREPAAYLETRFPFENYGWHPQTGLRYGGWKWIGGSEDELYDLGEDPGELSNRASDLAERADALRERAAGIATEERGMAEAVTLSESESRQLEALGYLGFGEPPPQTASLRMTELPDPHERIHLIRSRSTAAELFDRGFHGEALRLTEEILGEDSGNSWMNRQRVEMLVATGRLQEALAAVDAYSRIAPDDPEIRVLRGSIHETLGELDAADEEFAAAMAAGSSEGFRRRLWLWAKRHDSRRLDDEALGFLGLPEGESPEELAERGVQELSTDEKALVGELRRRDGAYLDALRILSVAQNEDSSSETLAVEMAWLLRERRDFSAIRALLASIRKRGLTWPDGWLLLGEACSRLGDEECTARSFLALERMLSGRLADWLRSDPLGFMTPMSADEIRGLVEAVPDSGLATESRLALAEGRMSAGDFGAVKEILTLVVEALEAGDGGAPQAAGSPPVEALRAAATASRIGNACWDRGRFWCAAQAFRIGAALVPADAGFRFSLGLSFERLLLRSAALEAFEACLAIDADFHKARKHADALHSMEGRGGLLLRSQSAPAG